MKEKVGYGIIGCGVISPWHAGAVRNIPDAELIAVCDIIPERAEKLKEDFGVKYAFTDYHEMLKRDDIDIVSVCTPSGMHADIGMDVARAGKNVLTEKPIDVTLEKIDQLVQVCKEENVKLACILQRRASGLWRRVKRTVDEGKLGKMVLASIYVKYYRGQEYYDSDSWRGTWALDGGGAMMNQGIHIVDLLRWIMGPVDTVFGFTGHLVRKIEVEDTAVASLKFKNGAFGTMEVATSINPTISHRLEFHGENGTIMINGEDIIRWDVPGEDKETVQKESADIVIGDANSHPTALTVFGHQAQISDLIAAIRENRDPMMTGAEARNPVELILAVYKSSQTGQPVKL